jgi:hypothetical protein
MRAADALEKLSRTRSELLVPHRRQLLMVASQSEDHAVRWNLVQTLARLPVGKTAIMTFGRRLQAWFLTDPSMIVRTCALDALVTIAAREPRLRDMARQLLSEAQHSASAAIRARARRLRGSLPHE